MSKKRANQIKLLHIFNIKVEIIVSFLIIMVFTLGEDDD